MMKVAVIGASGRLGAEVVRMLHEQSPDVEVVATYHRNKPTFPGTRTLQLDLGDATALDVLASECDCGIDCSGPSEWFGARISRAFSRHDTPLVSVGHTRCEQASRQVYRAGALPGILAAAFRLVDTTCERREVIYCFEGIITPSSAVDILAGDYRDTGSHQCGKPRSKVALTRSCLPFFDEDIGYLAQRDRKKVDSFSAWPASVLESFGAAQAAGLERGSKLLSLASLQAGVGDGVTRVYVFGDPAEGKPGKLIEIPSVARMSAAAVWYVLASGRLESLGKAVSMTEMLGPDAGDVLKELLVCSGATLRDVLDVEGMSPEFFEEGSL